MEQTFGRIIVEWGQLGVIALMFVGLFHAVQSGALMPRNSVSQLADRWERQLEREREFAGEWRSAYVAEREARVRQEEATKELLAASRVVVDAIAALRAIAESEAP